MNVLAIIIARSGSKGLPNKNLLKIENKTLIEYSVAIAKKAKLVNKIIFSSDSKKYGDLAKKSGAEVPFLRPKKLASDNASSWDVVRHAVDWLNEKQKWKADIIVLMQPNTPLLKPKHVDSVIKKVIGENFSAAMTVREVDYPPEWMFHISKANKLIPLLKNKKKIKRRQEGIKTYQPAGTAYAVKYERLKLKDPINYINLSYIIVPYEEAINIDTYKDFIIAKSFWKLKNEKNIL